MKNNTFIFLQIIIFNDSGRCNTFIFLQSMIFRDNKKRNTPFCDLSRQ